MLYSFSRQAMAGAYSAMRGAEAAHLERERLQAVSRFRDLDVSAVRALGRAAEIAATIAGTPFGACTLVDDAGVHIVASYGLEGPLWWPRSPGLCATTVALDRPRVIERADLDRRTCLHPLVTGETGLRFYLGTPLRTSDGYNVGTLCAIDQTARSVDNAAIAAIEAVADLAVHTLEHASDGTAPYDARTGLPGRRLFDERTERLAREENWGRSWGAIAVVYVDGMTAIEKMSGGLGRQRALCAVADALRATLDGEADTFHVADEEFAVIAGVAATYEPSRLKFLIDRALQTVRLAGFPQVHGRLGTATYDEAPLPRAAYRLADWRMYGEMTERQTSANP